MKNKKFKAKLTWKKEYYGSYIFPCGAEIGYDSDAKCWYMGDIHCTDRLGSYQEAKTMRELKALHENHCCLIGASRRGFTQNRVPLDVLKPMVCEAGYGDLRRIFPRGIPLTSQSLNKLSEFANRSDLEERINYLESLGWKIPNMKGNKFVIKDRKLYVIISVLGLNLPDDCKDTIMYDRIRWIEKHIYGFRLFTREEGGYRMVYDYSFGDKIPVCNVELRQNFEMVKIILDLKDVEITSEKLLSKSSCRILIG